ncbi:chorismate-binding protein [Pontibacter liquoris]|uniref:chorismate-binding protein n=1 Tax=Pontibacter liquoris TaxID=2905677 RepID=UPI001FA76341|nr:chorismate-binding protein [Pontibacter liquoris]
MGDETRIYTLDDIFSAAVAAERAVAIWRLPEAAEVQLCLSLQAQLQTGQPILENSPPGFLFCPFQTTLHQNIFIKADVTFDAISGQLTPAPDVPVEPLKQFYELLAQPVTASWHAPAVNLQALQQTDASYTQAVTDAVTALQAGEMEKVVLSRNKVVPLPGNFSAVAAFEELRAAYPRAFVSLVSIPHVGTWLGTSPEILVSIDEQNIFRTVALAGTQPAGLDNAANAIWRQKEIEEQAMVERYILSCFKRLRLRDYNEVGPRTVTAGNLMHLRTDFTVDLKKEVGFPKLGTDMLELLHPTSAVCGLPKAPALQFILQHEGYDRSYYSGYLGPVNSAAGTHLYVNLRCMQLVAQEAILYAGAGITADSSPEKEWQETQHKMQTIGWVLETENDGITEY